MAERAGTDTESAGDIIQPLADAARLRLSMGRLYEICTEIANKAEEVVLTRCPYKDATARCTADFGCRNQFFTTDPDRRPVCTGSDQLDYRRVWDVSR